MQQQPLIPEKHFKKVPKSLSGYSEIASISPYETKGRIILDNPDDVKQALNIWHNKNIEIEVSDLVKSENRELSDFVERILMPNQFEVQRHGDKYLFEFTGAYTDQNPLGYIANQLKKDRELVKVGVKVDMGTVDTWWFNIDFKQLLKNFDVSDEKAEGIAKYIAREDGRWDSQLFPALFPTIPRMYQLLKDKFAKRDEIKEEVPNYWPNILNFEHEGSKYNTKIDLDANKAWYYYKIPHGKEKPDKAIKCIEARGTSVVGPAWPPALHNEINEPTATFVNFDVSFGKQDSSDYIIVHGGMSVIDIEAKARLIEARDYLVGKLRN